MYASEQSPEVDHIIGSRHAESIADSAGAEPHSQGTQDCDEPIDREPMPRPSSGGEEGVPRRTSKAQVEANRRNATKSTGPRTAAGKRQSSLNAMTHGAYGRAQAAIPRGVLIEDEWEVEQYIEAIVKSLAPRDAQELVIAQRIALADLRLARLERFEGVALGKVGRLRPDLGELPEYEVDAAAEFAAAAQLAALSVDGDSRPATDVGRWWRIAHLIWNMHNVPTAERHPPDISFEDENAPEAWRRFVLDQLIPNLWDSPEGAVAALEAEAAKWARICGDADGKAEERAVTDALSKGGPLDQISMLRARVQREGDRDRATYAKLQQQMLVDDDDEAGVPEIDADLA